MFPIRTIPLYDRFDSVGYFVHITNVVQILAIHLWLQFSHCLYLSMNIASLWLFATLENFLFHVQTNFDNITAHAQKQPVTRWSNHFESSSSSYSSRSSMMNPVKRVNMTSSPSSSCNHVQTRGDSTKHLLFWQNAYFWAFSMKNTYFGPFPWKTLTFAPLLAIESMRLEVPTTVEELFTIFGELRITVSFRWTVSCHSVPGVYLPEVHGVSE